jgi:hypothetical protein
MNHGMRKHGLGHIVSWDISFSKNVLDAVENRKPNPFRGSLTEVNERGVQEMSQYSINELIHKIREAQTIVENNIMNTSVKVIAYKKG